VSFPYTLAAQKRRVKSRATCSKILQGCKRPENISFCPAKANEKAWRPSGSGYRARINTLIYRLNRLMKGAPHCHSEGRVLPEESASVFVLQKSTSLSLLGMTVKRGLVFATRQLELVS
jgi:hypothetical protein